MAHQRIGSSDGGSITEADAIAQRQLLLLLVAYHPSPLEVEQLQACLAELPPEVG